MMRSGLAIRVTIGSALVLTALIAGPASAIPAGNESRSGVPDVAPLSATDGVSEAEMADLTTLATQSDQTLESVIRRYAWNDNFAHIVGVIRAAWPDDFAGAEISGETSAWVAFRAAAPQGVSEELGALKAIAPDVQVVLREGLGLSEIELLRVIEDVHGLALNAGGVESATTTFDYATRTITTRVLGEKAAPVELSARIRSVVGLANHHLELVVAPMGSAPGVDSLNYHFGGEALSGACTTGFGTIGSGVRGISTAGHCGNAQSDDGSALTYKAGHEGTHGDFQWHTGPKTEADDFYAGNDTGLEFDLRDVSGIAAPVVGMSLCKNGATNYKDCQEVRSLNVCTDSLCNLVQMGARLAAGGDSGGPVYWGNTAYGLHQGWMYDPAFPFDRDVFSRADRIDNALGIYIATS